MVIGKIFFDDRMAVQKRVKFIIKHLTVTDRSLSVHLQLFTSLFYGVYYMLGSTLR